MRYHLRLEAPRRGGPPQFPGSEDCLAGCCARRTLRERAAGLFRL